MQFNDFIEGCQILNKYYNGNAYPMNPSRDEIYFEPTKIPIEKDDFLRLIKLGWVQEDGEEDTSEYIPDSYWIAYT